MGIALSTAGITVGYAIETTKGTRPTSGYTLIPDIKEVPEMNPEPEALETTTLAETEYKTYIDGLKDLGGSLAFGINFTQELSNAWGTLVQSSKTARADGKETWFEIKHPDLEKSVFFPCRPVALGIPGAGANSVWDSSVYVVPTGEPIWETKSTEA
uniref:Major tail protein n=1 Tax=Siphoviridae sp. ctBmU27 TaxID=2826189 RepID=A0A8S5NB81_9CAUD|nr:MAG TPA: Major tail protein [Siphoviridae sp. ctBmU27]